MLKICVVCMLLNAVDISSPLPLQAHSHSRRSVPVQKPQGNSTKMETRILNNPNKRRVVFEEGNADQDIIFPDSFEATFEPIPRIDGAPRCAKGATFCESFDAYPYQQIKEALNTNKVKKDFFGEEEAPIEKITNRVGEAEDNEKFVCRAIQRTVHPRIGKDKNDLWRYIVNQGENDGYVQGILIETCVNPGGSCDIIGSLPEGYQTSCRQKYVYRRMLSMDEKGTLVPENFQIPSACCCAYKVDSGYLSRFGRPVSTVR